jgi:hypothetical protein
MTPPDESDLAAAAVCGNCRDGTSSDGDSGDGSRHVDRSIRFASSWLTAVAAWRRRMEELMAPVPLNKIELADILRKAREMEMQLREDLAAQTSRLG